MLSVLLCAGTLITSSCGDDDGEDEPQNNQDTTEDTDAQPIGAFSVSSTKQVMFSPGNLQYQPSTNTWRFAPAQTDTIGFYNQYISDVSYDGWIDLFGWGTGDAPIKSSSNSELYSEFTDWGKNIGDGTTWYTLSDDEWTYVIHSRKNAKEKSGVASVNGVNGRILLPDTFHLPDGLTFNSSGSSEFGADYFKTVNDYTADQWAKMESAGAVFLPAAGERDGNSVSDVGTSCNYWSRSPYQEDAAYDIWLVSNGGALHNWSFRFFGGSVRLVRDL